MMASVLRENVTRVTESGYRAGRTRKTAMLQVVGHAATLASERS